MNHNQALIEVRELSKRYGDLVALDSVSITFKPGQVHAVIGTNGAGKSTLMNLLNGQLQPSSGEILVQGNPVHLSGPLDARKVGIEMVHQHFMLVPGMTIVENIALDRMENLRGRLKSTQLAARAQSIAAELQWEFEADAPVETLSVGQKQRVEILKALSGDASVLILDEPTAVLSEAEVSELFRVLAKLRSEGKLVILIAHKLSEVLAIADTITVLRNGVLQGTWNREQVDAPALSLAMVGELIDQSSTHKPTPIESEPVLVLQDLSVLGDRGNRAVRGASLAVAKGEILGIGGVDGNGQVELAEAAVGIRAFQGQRIAPNSIGYIPQDRHAQGLVLGMSLLENFMLAKCHSKGMISFSSVSSWATQLVKDFHIKIDRMSDLAGSLSGGNQQKIVVSRVVSQNPELIVAVNPTRGLDFRSTEFVHHELRRMALGGAAVLLVSGDRDELAALADRSWEMSGGHIAPQ